AAVADQLVLLDEGHVAAAGPPARLLADVEGCVRAGIRPPDVSRLFVALGLPDPPLALAAAVDRLRAAGRACRTRAAGVASPRSGSPLVVVDAVTHRWPDGRTALTDVGLEIGRGELVALVGHNGAGKTTLAKHLNGLLAPSAGSVRLDGTEV